jgi:DNA-binding YbaB/EbfC family protein
LIELFLKTSQLYNQYDVYHLINLIQLNQPFNLNRMFDKLFEAQQKAGEVKKRLDGITVSGSAEGGKITVTANGNKVIQSISINEDLFKAGDKEELEELLLVAINKALEQAENVSQSEMAALTKNMFGDLGNMLGK